MAANTRSPLRRWGFEKAAQVSSFALVLVLSAAGALAQSSPPPPLLSPGVPFPPAVADPGGPRIQFASPVHDFGRILSGGSVKHEFIFTNGGTATLHISNVITSCGCTTAGQWSRTVEPGQTGIIPVQFNSGAFQGMIFKTVTIQSNDKQQPSVLLQLKGDIWKPVEVNPGFAVLQANSETLGQAKAAIRILNREDAPLTLEPPQSLNPLFAVELRTNQPGRDFELLVTVAQAAPVGNSQGVITLKTSSSNAPVLNVTAMLVLQPAVGVTPPQVHLPPAPLPNSQAVTVSVMNNGTNTLALSEARVNATNVGVDLKETAPGRYYNLTLTFPAGFELAPGQTVELSVKSNHPQFPVIHVPILQPPRPAAAPLAAAPRPFALAPPPAPVAPQPAPVRPATRPRMATRPLLAPPPLPPLPGDLGTNAIVFP